MAKNVTGATNGFLNLIFVTHPTGAVSEYTYERVDKNLFVPNTQSFLPGEFPLSLLGLQEVYRITSRKDKIGADDFNHKEYIYSANNNSGWSTVVANRVNGHSLPANFTYSTTVRTVGTNLEETHTFDRNHMTTSIVARHSGRNVESRAFLYDRNHLPTRITTTIFDYTSSASMQSIKSFQYDTRGNVTASWSPLANGSTTNTEHRTSYTYDTTSAGFNQLTNITYKQNPTTTISITYTLDSARRHPLTETIRINPVSPNPGTQVSRTDWTYSTQGNILTERRYTDGGNNTANSILTTYTYDRNAYLASIRTDGVQSADNTNVAGTPGFSAGVIVTRFGYDTLGRLTSMTDSRGNVTGYQYNAKNDIIRTTHPGGAMIQYARSYTVNYLTITEERGNQITTQYNPLGFTSEIRDGGTTGTILNSKTYDTLSRLFTDIDLVNNSVTTYEYDHLNRIKSAKTQHGSTTFAHEEYAYSVSNGLFRTTNTQVGDDGAPSIVTINSVDNMGFVRQAGFVSAAYLNTFSHDYLGNITETWTAGDAQHHAQHGGRPFSMRYQYDYANRVTRETNSLDPQHVTHIYDALGRKTSATDRRGNTTNFEYDNLNRLIRQFVPFEGTHRAVTRYFYDQAGNLTREEAQNNTPGAAATWTRTDYIYNNRNFLTRADSYNGASIAQQAEYTHDATGNVLTMRTGTAAANHAMTEYRYDRFGNVIRLIDALGQEENFTYYFGGAGNLHTKTDRNRAVTTYTYDGLGRPITISAGSSTISHEYTLTGQLRAQTQGSFTQTNKYDAFGRLREQTEPGGIVKIYDYDIGGNRTSYTVNGTTTTYTYDALNRLETVSKNGILQATYAYDANGNRQSLVSANGVTTTYAYNLANLVTNLTNRRGNTDLSKYTYSYYLDGSKRTKTDLNNRVTTYIYDGLGRLTQEAESGGSAPSANMTMTYQYNDSRGNRTDMIVTGAENYTVDYSYDLNNRLLESNKQIREFTETSVFEYDRNGNQLSDGVKTFEYDGFDRMVSAQIGGVSTSYTYRPDGLRHSKTTTEIHHNPITTVHVWDGSNISLDITGENTVKYIRGIGLIAADGLFGYTGRQFYLYNAHGSVVQLADSNGNVTQSYDYDAFGNERRHPYGDVDGSGYINAADVTALRRYIAASCKDTFLAENSWFIEANADVNGDGFINAADVTQLRRYIAATVPATVQFGTPDGNNFRFAGEYWDWDTQTYYLRARVYDPRTGRFTKEDPYWRTQRNNDYNIEGLNLYLYCQSNPVNRIDPWGLDSWIFYDSGDEAHGNSFVTQAKAEALARLLRLLYGTPVHLVSLTTVDDLIMGWNSMGTVNGKTVSIDG
jgi:RHS repeat-associated protein